MSDVVVVEAKAVVRFTNLRGKMVDKTGVFAVQRDLIAASLERLPDRRLQVLDRAPSEGEINVSLEQGLVPAEQGEGGPSGDDPTRTLDELLRPDVDASADLLGIDKSGNKPEVLERIKAEAERLEVDVSGPGLEAVQRIHDAQQAATDTEGE